MNAIGSNQWITRLEGFWTYEASLTPAADYSLEPPSNRTSTSPCIRLYGPTTRRLVKPSPYPRLVRPGLPGVVVDLRGVLPPPVARGIDREVSNGTLNENNSRGRASDSRPLPSQYRTGRNITRSSQNGCNSMTTRGNEAENS